VRGVYSCEDDDDDDGDEDAYTELNVRCVGAHLFLAQLADDGQTQLSWYRPYDPDWPNSRLSFTANWVGVTVILVARFTATQNSPLISVAVAVSIVRAHCSYQGGMARLS